MTTIKVLETAIAEDGEQILLRNVSFRGSDLFSGIFNVVDLDSAVRKDLETGREFVAVCCQCEDDAKGDTILELELHADKTHLEGIIGGGVDVITRIAFE